MTLLNTSNQTILDQIKPPSGEAESSLAGPGVSTDGRELAVGSEQGTICLWSIAQPDRPRLRFRLPGHRGITTSLVFDAQGRRLASAGGWTPWSKSGTWSSSSASSASLQLARLNQCLQQQLELADLDFAVEGVFDPVDDRYGERAIVAVPLKLSDDPGVIDLSLADADLELARPQSGIAEVDVVDIGKNDVEIHVPVRALQEVARVESQDQAGDGLAQLHGGLRVGGQGLRMGQEGQHQSLSHGAADQRREPFDLVLDRRAGWGRMRS